tara:strand:+ start:1839 stop:2678 length:840 start_codon:yes stop_codon:yes gene_type:complete
MSTTETRTLPAPFIEAAGTTLTEKLIPVLGQPIDTAAFAPTVAAQDPLQLQAVQQASGLGSFQPFLTQAGADAAAAQQFTGPQAFQEFMSPYQQEVIDTSLAALQRERDIARQQLGTQAAQLGAFGGGRQGLQEGAFDAETALGKAQLEAQLRQQGFQQAQQAAQQAFANQQALSTQQQGLAQLAPQLAQQQITGLQQLGQGQQAQAQAILDAQANAAREAAFEEQQRLGFVGQQLTGLIGGYPAQATFQTTMQQPPSPLQSILGIGGGIASILGAFNT